MERNNGKNRTDNQIIMDSPLKNMENTEEKKQKDFDDFSVLMDFMRMSVALLTDTMQTEKKK